MQTTIKSFVPNGQLRVPSSKSYSHRYLIAAFISNKPITITNLNMCDDVITTIDALKKMGAILNINGNTAEYMGREIPSGPIVIDAKESGTTLRMLFPIASYLFDDVTFLGKPSLMSRPMGVYEDILTRQKIKYEKTNEFFRIYSKLKLDNFTIAGDVSSQFASGLLFLNAFSLSKKKLTIIPPIASKSYIAMTLNVLEELGYLFSSKNNTHKFIRKTKVSATLFDVEVDYSLVANFAVLAALKGKIKLLSSNTSSLQGDSIIIDFLSRIGVKVKFDNESVTVSHQDLCPFDLDLTDCIDLGPTMFILAACIPGISHFSGSKRLEYKESNRLNVMVKVLNKVGVETKVLANDIYIYGKDKIVGDYSFEACHDHRIAMALAILGMVVEGSVTINESEAISKSYPRFFEDLFSLKRWRL